jgi:very-short-patch-repair endonuclease
MSNSRYDSRRTEKLKEEGFQVLRFWNIDVLKNVDEVLEVIFNELESIKAPLTRRLRRRPLPQGER